MCKFNKIDLVEGIDVEFKSNFDFENKPFVFKIYKTIRAFANTNGGRLLIGVNDKFEIVGIQQEEIDKIIRHLSNTFHNKVKLTANAIMDTNSKWYLDFYIYKSERFIYEDKQENTICIRDNSSLKILKGNDIIDFWNKKSYCNKKINNFFKENCNVNLFIDWKYSINETFDLNLKIEKFWERSKVGEQ